MIPGLYFTYGVVALFLVVNALRSPTGPDHRLPPLYLPGLVAAEMAGVWLAVIPAVSALTWALGGLESAVGRAGLVLSAIAFAGQLVVWRRSHSGADAVGGSVALPEPLPHRAVSYPRAMPNGVRRTRHAFADHPHRDTPLRLDLYTRDAGPVRGVVLHVHGGGWRGGHPRQAGQTILHHLARRGWAVASIEYPLSPAATFPEHLIGIDAAHRWLTDREDLAGPLVVMGASAGAHLAATAGLTRPWADGVIGLYGIYDFLNRHRTRPDWPLIPDLVMKARPEEDPERYRAASPIDLVHPGAPPFLLVHGTHDSVVPPAESRHFHRALTDEGVAVELVEVPWGQHGFDALAGKRARAVAARIGSWLDASFASDRDAAADRIGDP